MIPWWFKYLTIVYAFAIREWKFLLIGAGVMLLLIFRRFV